MNSYFTDEDLLLRTRNSMLLQGFVTLILFLFGVAMLFPAPKFVKTDKPEVCFRFFFVARITKL